ncbi:MAG: porphobilinogen synthase [Crocinitomicaceae bacterium]
MLSRPRRNRKSESIRSMVRENRLELANLIYPIFLVDGEGIKDEVQSLPGNYRWSIDLLLKEIRECIDLGITNFVMFPAVAENLKDPHASYSHSADNFYLKAANKIKSSFPEICLISDVAMDPYSSEGHDGFVENGEIVNDKTLPILCEMAVAQAKAGFDILGPSDMMDGRIGAIREALDEAGYYNTGIMAYTAKYASAFYGPFRDALDSAPKGGDKKTYQMDPSNSKEAIREAILDEEEGADFLMVKPGLPYLDIVKTLSEVSSLPIAVYNVSGECAMLRAACDKGWLDFEKAMPEMLLSFKRAGATSILTYFAKEYALLLKEGKV